MENMEAYIPQELRPKGFNYPESFRGFVDSNTRGVAMVGLPPWVLAGKEDWALKESENVYGELLVPFAQAEFMDMIAYFKVGSSSEPEVLVGNPWSHAQDKVIKVFDNFHSWLLFAQNVSSKLLEERPDLLNNKFWFPQDASTE